MTDDRGRDAPSPWKMPTGGWVAALKRTWKEMGDDNVGLIAAGTAFYAFASIIPVLAAVVLSYGLFAEPATVRSNIEALFANLPQEAASIIGDQLLTVMRTEGGKQGFGLLAALAIALYGGTKAASAIVTALNIAYERDETRGVVKLYLLYFAIVAGAVLLVFGAIASTTVLAFLDGLFPDLGGAGKFFIRLLSYLAIAALAITAGACLFRYGPDRPDAGWAWLTPGSAIATLLWLIGTALFGVYVSNFANYGATYGSLSAVIVLLTWLWLSAYVYLFGAELNSELERETRRDKAAAAGRSTDAHGAVAGAVTADGDAGDRRRGEGATVAATALGLRAAGGATGRKPGLAPTLLTAFGLSRLGRGGRGAGAALVATGAALAWLRREKPKPKARKKAAPAARP